MKELKFNNPIFNIGTNLTCRLGTKWANEVGEEIRIGDRIAVIEMATVKHFCDIDEQEDGLILEHDPDCRDKEGLEKEMESIYEGFERTSVVTLVYFYFK